MVYRAQSTVCADLALKKKALLRDLHLRLHDHNQVQDGMDKEQHAREDGHDIQVVMEDGSPQPESGPQIFQKKYVTTLLFVLVVLFCGFSLCVKYSNFENEGSNVQLNTISLWHNDYVQVLPK